MCNLDRDEMSAGQKRTAILQALKVHDETMTTSDIRAVTPLDSNDMRNHPPKLESNDYIEVNRLDDDEKDHLPRTFCLTGSGEEALANDEYATVASLTEQSKIEQLEEEVAQLRSEVDRVDADSSRRTSDERVEELESRVDEQAEQIRELEREALTHEVRSMVLKNLVCDQLDVDYDDLFDEEWHTLYQDLKNGEASAVYGRVAKRL